MMMQRDRRWWRRSVRWRRPHLMRRHPGEAGTPCLHHHRRNISKAALSFMLKM